MSMHVGMKSVYFFFPINKFYSFDSNPVLFSPPVSTQISNPLRFSVSSLKSMKALKAWKPYLRVFQHFPLSTVRSSLPQTDEWGKRILQEDIVECSARPFPNPGLVLACCNFCSYKIIVVNGTDLCYGKCACHVFFLSVVSKLLLRKWFSGYIECTNVEHDVSATTTHAQSYNGQRDAASCEVSQRVLFLLYHSGVWALAISNSFHNHTLYIRSINSCR